MMGKDERECVKLPFGEYLKVPYDKKGVLRHTLFHALR